MATVNGIRGNGKVLFEGVRSPTTHLQMARLLGLRATPAARERLQSYIQTGKNPARLITLFERTCASLHLELGKFTEQGFIERFANWRIEGLNNELSPNSPDYQIRFLLERIFNCGLAYHNESGLAMVTSEERGDIAKGDAEGYQLACPFAAKLQIIAPPISSPLPRVNLARRVVALVKRMAQPLAEKRSYSEQLTERILFHVTEGHSRSAAFLLFRDKTAREILDFVREENLAKKISSPEWAALLRIGMRPDIDYSVPSEEIAIGYLLAEAHPVISAYFIEDLAKSDPHSAARILGLVGQTTRSVEVAEAGDLISDVERSLAGYVLSAMLIRGQEKLANRVVAQGMREAIFRGTYERVLAEMNVDFDENIATADKYDGSSLFRAGSVFFREVGGEGSTAIIKVKDGPYGWGGEELLSPRLFYRNLARKLIEGEGYDLAWEMMTCGRPAVEAFNDLNSVLDPASFGRLLRTRGRDEIARFVVEILAGGEEYIEALAYVLRDTHEDIRDVAGLFEYLIEADGEIAGSREAAYAILYYAATAIENPSMAPLLDRYQEILVQIEQDKESAGWFNADVFLKEGRFLPTDPPSKAREDRIKFYFDLLQDTIRPENDRVYAARMLGRMGAVEGLDDLSGLLKKSLDSDDPITPWIINLYLDLVEELDPKTPPFRKHSRLLLSLRDRLAFIFSSRPEEAHRLIAEASPLDEGLLKREETGRRRETKNILKRCSANIEQYYKGNERTTMISKMESLVFLTREMLTSGQDKPAVEEKLVQIAQLLWEYLYLHLPDNYLEPIVNEYNSIVKSSRVPPEEVEDKLLVLISKQEFTNAYFESKYTRMAPKYISLKEETFRKFANFFAKIKFWRLAQKFDQKWAAAKAKIDEKFQEPNLTASRAIPDRPATEEHINSADLDRSYYGKLMDDLHQSLWSTTKPRSSSYTKWERGISARLKAIAIGLTRLDRLEEALNILEEVISSDKVDAYHEMAIILAEAGSAQKAFNLTRRISPYHVNISTLLEVPRTLSGLRAPPETIKTLIIDAVSATQTARGDWDRHYEYEKIIELLSEIRLPIEVLNEILAAFDFHSGSLEKKSYKASARRLLAPLRARAGFFNAALRDRRSSPDLYEIAREIHNFPIPQTPNLTPLEQVLAWLHTRIYAVLGMGEE